MNEQFEDYIQEAIELVDAWEIPEEDYAQAVVDQARLMCGLALEPSIYNPTELPFASLRF
jgi:hypothetical protein